MATKYENLSSMAQLTTVMSKNSVVVIDFHAVWCGPCKVVAPVFESLAARHAAPGKVAFAKCDVDACSAIAQQYQIRAMPTFVIIKNRLEVERVQGADRSSLTSAVERHVKDAKPASGFATSGKGYKLGDGGSGPLKGAQSRTYLRDGQVSTGLPLTLRVNELINTVIAFFGLYFVSLLSLDPILAAERSEFANYKKRSAGSGPPGRRLGTLQSTPGTGDVRTTLRGGPYCG